MRGAGLGAGRGFTHGETLLAHVAFADDAEAFVEFRDVVGTFQDAVAAANALVVEMADDAGDWIFFIGDDRTAVEAGRVGAMVTGGGYGLLVRRGGCATVNQTNVAPGFVVIEAVKRMTGGDAGFASGAGVEINFEGVLFSRAGGGQRNERAGRRAREPVFVERGKAGDRSLEALLFEEQFAEERRE